LYARVNSGLIEFTLAYFYYKIYIYYKDLFMTNKKIKVVSFNFFIGFPGVWGLGKPPRFFSKISIRYSLNVFHIGVILPVQKERII
jgi:hypothetical protein